MQNTEIIQLSELTADAEAALVQKGLDMIFKVNDPCRAQTTHNRHDAFHHTVWTRSPPCNQHGISSWHFTAA